MIMKKLLIVLSGAFVVSLAFYSIFRLMTDRNLKLDANELAGVSIGDSRQQVLYKLGQPDQVGSEEGELPVLDIPAGRTIDNYVKWVWHKPSPRETTFADQGVSEIQCWDNPNAPQYCWTVRDISLASEETDLVRELGEPTQVSYQNSPSSTRKILDYDDFGLTFALAQGRITAIHKRKR
jgi:hypothetical protein